MMPHEASQYVAVQIGNAASLVASYIVEESSTIREEFTRPSVLFRPTVCLDGNKWCALYGSNIMEGVVGWGDSPDEACKDFDRVWKKGE